MIKNYSGDFFYSVMQSDGNSFFVLDSFDKAYRDEGNILYQIYEKQICKEFYYKEFKFNIISEKMHNNIRVH